MIYMNKHMTPRVYGPAAAPPVSHPMFYYRRTAAHLDGIGRSADGGSVFC
ncbi:hypothetical protein GS8_1128 [Geobacillus stearothermophilus]|uniref:Uncharacterized protein n=1 Tax=Geobacillus stearothermophilus TaxID=1422 RepID=A0ABQ7HHC1_GEOSE|nr:hypothetical protein GS8_1128 [Geobacillus stearothermophilus]